MYRVVNIGEIVQMSLRVCNGEYQRMQRYMLC